MEILVVYKSKTDFTKRYAQWIQEALSCNLVSAKNLTDEMLSSYDLIIFGSYIRVEKIRGLEKLWKRFQKNSSQKLISFSTGASSFHNKEQIESIWERSISTEVLQSVPHFYMQSGLNYEKMSLFEKAVMKVFACIMNQKKAGNFDHLSETNPLGKSFDVSSKDFILPLVKYVEGMKK